MSAIGASLVAGQPLSSLPLHALCRMESGVTPVVFLCGPIGCHPRRPAQLPEMTQTGGFNCAWRNGQLDVPVELGTIVGIDEVRERLAQIAAGQKSNVLRQRLG